MGTKSYLKLALATRPLIEFRKRPAGPPRPNRSWNGEIEVTSPRISSRLKREGRRDSLREFLFANLAGDFHDADRPCRDDLSF